MSFFAKLMAQQIPLPLGRTVGQSTRVVQASYNGAMFFLPEPVLFNRVIYRLTAATTPATVSLLIYSGTIPSSLKLLATTSFAVAAGAQTAVLTPTEGLVTGLGVLAIIFGIKSGAGSATMRTYGVSDYDLLTSNISAGTYPVTFTTAISGATTPTTFDPTAQTPGAALDLAPVVRLLHV